MSIWSASFAAVICLSGCGGNGEQAEAPSPADPSGYAERCQLPPGPLDALHLPAPTGEQCVGKTAWHLVDAKRAEQHTPDEQDRRELGIKVWYPMVSTASGARAAYLDPNITESVRAQLSIPTKAPGVQTNAKSEGPLQPGSMYPVVIFSAGYGMVVETYSTLLEELASHGIVVVAVDHPYISGATAMANGKVVQPLAGPAPGQSLPGFLDDAVATMVADQRFVLDWLQGPGTGVLNGHLNLARIGLVGHSIGGAAAVQTARSDARAKAGLDIDGTVYGGTAGAWQKPVMFLLAANHVWEGSQGATWSVHDGQVTLARLLPLLAPGDTVVEGGNSFYKDTMRRGEMLAAQGIHYVDCGTSGGVWGLAEGYSLMIGGDVAAVDALTPLFATLAPATDRGWARVGPSGSGHFTKMVHNGIEYGMMQAYAEGFAILQHKTGFNLDLHQVAEVWREGSVVRSWLLDLTADALAKNPTMAGIAPYVEDSGEGRWTVAEAVDLNVAAPVITLSLLERLRSRDDDSFVDKLLAAMRNQFGGHRIKTE